MKKIGMFFLSLSLIMIPSFNAKGADSSNWGLSFPTPGEKPVGNEKAEKLKEYEAYYVAEGDEKAIYLTFDAGYENGLTESILDTLKEKEVPAAFFLVGTYIRDHGDLVKRMVEENHMVGNHTTSHPDMSKILTKDSFINELSQTENYYKDIIGEDMPKFYRPPQGKYNEANMQMANELGYKTVFWSLAYMDWDNNNQPTKEQAFSKLLPRVHPGAIILLHSTSKTNCDILGELIDKYMEMGYTFKSLDELQ